MSEAYWGLEQNLKTTPLYKIHNNNAAKLVSFAGYYLPIQYANGIIAEHNHTRKAASVFDVSHMGQIKISGPMIHDALEKILPISFSRIAPGQIKYTQFLNKEGKIIDDLMIHRSFEDNQIWLVVNADCTEKDLDHLYSNLNRSYKIELIDDRALIAIQGPKSSNILKEFFNEIDNMPFMTGDWFTYDNEQFFVSRCGYTGEDGYEVSIKDRYAEEFISKLLKFEDVKLAGLGARNSLRMEAGLCLYGNDISILTSPVEAGLTWSIPKERIENGGFIGHENIKKDLIDGVEKKLVGIKPLGKLPAREGTQILSKNGKIIGEITSGGYSPSLQAPIAMGYINAEILQKNCEILLNVRGNSLPAEIVSLPFVEHKYFRGKK
ncbi:MAG: glycine cleavage system aminomethyltransferase GcvT [Pseudomonadota bacterium]|jgi:aminomethyltransferase|nr:glycine cleavage system aminomethyltransferase GcvT [Pseudomonadota bacterium]MED5253743.1 glycine cleavage system aminomethyltransferase GcvT [Pseudomonadota bacterium]MED5272654.1 glycine cleavage system aminomethyltransferase GcvT [Pseudomonadota bacterium]MED5484266.1 glycine cleavage system aminomethyltransferase GcvT [Pseudomonadota bacterium]|tara:strand:- start:4045 stop:5181 length:1137 start_codon:yes stop_codon:yes gene_type:complete